MLQTMTIETLSPKCDCFNSLWLVWSHDSWSLYMQFCDFLWPTSYSLLSNSSIPKANWGVPSVYIKFIYYVTLIVDYLIMLQGCMAHIHNTLKAYTMGLPADGTWLALGMDLLDRRNVLSTWVWGRKLRRSTEGFPRSWQKGLGFNL